MRAPSSNPSATARMVARGLVYVANTPRFSHLVSGEAATLTEHLLIACAPGERRFIALLKRPTFRRLVEWLERRIAPGILAHYALRKRYLESAVESAIADGFAQIVILGAGLDTLALRLHRKHAGVPFIEVDRPATQNGKRRAIENGDVPAPEKNLHFVAADLAERTLPNVLRDCSAYDARKDTLFLAEGLLMYLTPSGVETLFQGVRDANGTAARCRFAFTFVETRADGRPAFAHSRRVLDFWLRLRGEPFRWGIKASDLPAWLGDKGFSVGAVVSPPELRALYLRETPPQTRVNGDFVCVADRKAEP